MQGWAAEDDTEHGDRMQRTEVRGSIRRWKGLRVCYTFSIAYPSSSSLPVHSAASTIAACARGSRSLCLATRPAAAGRMCGRARSTQYIIGPRLCCISDYRKRTKVTSSSWSLLSLPLSPHLTQQNTRLSSSPQNSSSLIPP
jgi:hypothetical protein